MSLHQNNKLLVLHDKRHLVSHWPPASEIGMLVITTFLELRVVAGRSRTRTGRPHAVSRRPMLIHTYHAVPMPLPCRDPAVALRGRFQNGIFVAWQGNSMVCVNQPRPHCVNQMGKTQSKPFAERHGLVQLFTSLQPQITNCLKNTLLHCICTKHTRLRKYNFCVLVFVYAVTPF
jgi:hypothetical protein